MFCIWLIDLWYISWIFYFLLYNICSRLYLAFVLFYSGRDRCNLYPLVCLSVSLLCFLWLWPVLVKDPCAGFGHLCWGGWQVGMVWGLWWGLGSPGRAYPNRFSLSPSSHSGHWTLILCFGTLEPQMHWCMDRTKVMAILLFTYLHIRE